ncbi:MAG: Eco47II family restriction endonuclease [Aggregatilineales bacterium]
MAYLSWISDEDLINAVKYVDLSLKGALSILRLETLQSNVIDPFSLLFETKLGEISVQQWIENETQRQTQKTVQNALGKFHEMILGRVNGWQHLGIGHETGLDLRNEEKTIYAELKNKYNTLNDDGNYAVREKLFSLIDKNPQVTAYLVHIIRKTKRPYNKEWIKKEGRNDPRVKVISGDLFYALVTSQNTALLDLYNKLPEVIESLKANEEEFTFSDSTAMEELKIKLGSENPTNIDFLKYFFESAYPKF